MEDDQEQRASTVKEPFAVRLGGRGCKQCGDVDLDDVQGAVMLSLMDHRDSYSANNHPSYLKPMSQSLASIAAMQQLLSYQHTDGRDVGVGTMPSKNAVDMLVGGKAPL